MVRDERNINGLIVHHLNKAANFYFMYIDVKQKSKDDLLFGYVRNSILGFKRKANKENDIPYNEQKVVDCSIKVSNDEVFLIIKTDVDKKYPFILSLSGQDFLDYVFRDEEIKKDFEQSFVGMNFQEAIDYLSDYNNKIRSAISERKNKELNVIESVHAGYSDGNVTIIGFLKDYRGGNLVFNYNDDFINDEMTIMVKPVSIDLVRSDLSQIEEYLRQFKFTGRTIKEARNYIETTGVEDFIDDLVSNKMSMQSDENNKLSSKKIKRRLISKKMQKC